jgi:hypothetical protein
VWNIGVALEIQIAAQPSIGGGITTSPHFPLPFLNIVLENLHTLKPSPPMHRRRKWGASISSGITSG